MDKTTVIARMLLLFAGPFGIASWLAGLIFINKGSKDRGITKINSAIEELKKTGTKLWMFPEGIIIVKKKIFFKLYKNNSLYF